MMSGDDRQNSPSISRQNRPSATVSNEDISDIILNEVLKREILDDEKSKEAKKKIAKALKPAPKPKIEASVGSEGQ